MLQLDFLRGVAILLVLVNHQIPEAIPTAGPFRALALFGKSIGWLGVDLFFVISGFLIGSLLFNELKYKKGIDVRRFFIRRGMRIWPAYYVFIACVAVSEWIRPTWAVLGTGATMDNYKWTLMERLMVNIFNIQNYTLSLRAHTWSLAVEEHFYLFLPFLLIASTRTWREVGQWDRPIVAVPWFTLGLFVCCSYFRIMNPIWHAQPNYFASHFRIDELFFGVLIAYWNCLRPGFTEAVGRHRSAVLTLSMVALAALVWVQAQNFRFGYSMVIPLAMIGFGTLLMALLTTPIDQGWVGKSLGSWPARVVAFIGVYSYSIYLWHPDLGVRMVDLVFKKGLLGQSGSNRTWVVVMIVLLVVEVFVGVIASRLIEEPTLALRDRLFPRRTSVITHDEAATSRVPLSPASELQDKPTVPTNGREEETLLKTDLV